MLFYFYVLLLLAVVLEGSSDLLFRQWGLERQKGAGQWGFFLFALAIYMMGATCWGLSLQFREVSRAIVAFAVLNTLMVAVAGVFFFGEKLTIINRIGILLGGISLIMVEWPSQTE